MTPWSPARAALLVAALGAAGSACAGDPLGAPPDAPDAAPAATTGALGPGPTVTFHLAVEALTCSASLRCPSALPLGDGLEEPALVTGFSCATRDGAEGGHDSLLTVARRVTCFDAGDLDDPLTWVPSATPPPDGVALGERAYAMITNAWGDAFANTARRLAPLAGYAFCRFEALAVLRSAPRQHAGRAPLHRAALPVARWDALILPGADGTFDCQLDGPAPRSHLTVAFAHAVSFDRPTPDREDAFPADHGLAVVELTPALPPTLRVSWVLDARAPTRPDLVPALADREVSVDDPDDPGAALDFSPRWSCADADAATGEIVRIVLAVSRAGADAVLGAVVLARGDADAPFHCDLAPSGRCLVHPVAGLEDVAACAASL